MKLALFGHSYVRHIERFGDNSIFLENTHLSVNYFGFPGAKFNTFRENTDLLSPLVSYKPDIIVIVLGGNDFANTVLNKTIYENYTWLISYLKGALPSVAIIQCQVEKRFVSPGNRWNASDTELLEKRRSAFNRKLNKCHLKDCTLRVQGPGRLDDRSNYGLDGIHLSRKGVATYWRYICQTVKYYLESVRK